MKKLLALLLVAAMAATTFTAASCSTVVVKESEKDDEDKDDKDEGTAKGTDEAESGKPDEPNPDEPNPDEPNPDEPKPDEPKPDEPKPDEPKPDEPKPDEPTDAATFFNDAIARTRNLKYFTQTTKTDTFVTMTADGETFSFSMPQTAVARVDQSDPDSMVMYYTQTVDQSQLGMGTTEIEMFMDSEWVYTSQHTAEGDVSLKYRIDAVGEEYSQTQNSLDMIKPLPEKYYDGYELVPDADGSYTIDVEIDLNDFSEIFSAAMDNAAANNGADVSDHEISNTSASITVKDGYVVKYKLAFDMSMAIEGIDTDYSFDFDITYTDIGNEYDLTLPEGFEDFPDYTDLLAEVG